MNKPGVVIHHLEVHLDVAGDDEEVAFARLFERHVRRWDRARSEAAARERLVSCDRQLLPRERRDEREG
jgi:hypothetical protein